MRRTKPRPRGLRSRKDARLIKCERCKEFLRVRQYEFFDIPVFNCPTCKKESDADFDFCMNEITVNNNNVCGDPMCQGTTELCEAFSVAKMFEITKKVNAVMKGEDPNVIPQMDPFDLQHQCTILVKKENDLKAKMSLLLAAGLSSSVRAAKEKPVNRDGMQQTITLTRLIQQRGIRDVLQRKLYKACNVTAICKDDHPTILAALANGFPLQASVFHGRKFGFHRYCRTYKPLAAEKMGRKRKPEDAPVHAVVLIGAVRKSGRLKYYCMNSWEQFCARRSEDGTLLSHGIGKIDARRLCKNVIRISRFKESPTKDSLLPENSFEQNWHLLYGKFDEKHHIIV